MAHSELQALAALARPLAMVLERARLVESLRQQTQRTRSVIELLATPVATALRSMFGADHCVVGTIESDRFLISGLDSGVTHHIDHGNTLPLTLMEGLDEAASNGYSVVANLDAPGAAQTQASAAIRALGIRSLMCAIISGADGPIGLVMLGSFSRDHFSEMDARQLAQVVQPLGVTAQYFRELREAKKRARRLELANGIIGRLSGDSSQRELAVGFLKSCLELFDATLGAAVRFEPDGSPTFIAIETTIHELADRAWPTTLSQRYNRSGPFHAGTEATVLDDLREAADMGRFHGLLHAHGLNSGLRAPLVVEDTIGAITLVATGTGHFDAGDAELLTALCRPLALALEKRAAMDLLAESERKYRSVVS